MYFFKRHLATAKLICIYLSIIVKCLELFFIFDVVISRSGTRNPGFRSDMGRRQVKHGFLSFIAKFLPYLMIFQSRAFRKCC